MGEGDDPQAKRLAPRRTQGVQAGGRAEEIVRRVLEATIEELGRVGYASLRVEHVATAAAVHKTSIYRRWSTKEALVSAALERETTRLRVHDTGDVVDDLVAAVMEVRAQTLSPRSRGAVRLVQNERGNEEVDRILERVRNRHIAHRNLPVERAISRGQLPASTSAAVVSDAVFIPMIYKLVAADSDADEAYVRELVELVVSGARSLGARRHASPSFDAHVPLQRLRRVHRRRIPSEPG